MSKLSATSVTRLENKEIHILLVEDNQADVHLMKHFLLTMNFPGRVATVGDGFEALRYLNQEGIYKDAAPPDVVLLDLGLPKLNGHEVLEQVRRNPKTQHIPILVLSSSKTDTDSKRSIELGANGFITKPSDLDEIERLVKYLVAEEIPRLLANYPQHLLAKKTPAPHQRSRR